MHIQFYSIIIYLLFIFSTQTPFVRQNTPHPKELKLKAHKLFAKEKSKQDDNLDNISEEVSIVVRIEQHKAFDEKPKAYFT